MNCICKETYKREPSPEVRCDHCGGYLSELTAALEGLDDLKKENFKLRKIAAHVPGMVYLKAKESAGFGEAMGFTDPLFSGNMGKKE